MYKCLYPYINVNIDHSRYADILTLTMSGRVYRVYASFIIIIITKNSQQFPGEMNIKFRTKTNKIVDISISVLNQSGHPPTDILYTRSSVT